MKLSIVTTVYKSSEYIEEFYIRISKEVQKITQDYEIIFVDDGSPDDSLNKVLKFFEKDSRIKILELSKNFGHHKAIMTGLSFAKGTFVFLIDSDLEEPPELLGQFWKEFHNQKNLDVLYGVQDIRRGRLFERFSGYMFYKIFNIISNCEIPKNLITTRLTTQAYNQALISHKERDIFLAGLWVTSGFNQRALSVKKLSYSKSSYKINTRLSLALTAIVSFSTFPLQLIFIIGTMITMFSFFYITFIIYKNIFLNITVSGWSSLIVSIWFLGGFIIFSIGIIGVYISKIYNETKQRPITIIKEKYEKYSS